METYRATSQTIACSLTAGELTDTQHAWRKLFRLSLVSREEIPGGLRLEVHPGSASALRQLMDIERKCCPWIDFELEGPVVTLTSSGAGEVAIRSMWTVSRSTE